MDASDPKIFEIINKIAESHCNKKFGYLSKEDLKNEIWVICLDKLKDFDYDKGELEHFLRVSVKNRLVNRFKEMTKSVRSPCPRCPFFNLEAEGECNKFGFEKYQCDKYRNFQLSTDSRNSLLNASEPKFERHASDNILNHVSASEIKERLIGKIDKRFDQDLKRLISGEKLSKQKTKKLKVEILRVLNPLPLTQLTINGE